MVTLYVNVNHATVATLDAAIAELYPGVFVYWEFHAKPLKPGYVVL